MSAPATKVKCELRTLISHQQYVSLKGFFANVGTLKGEDHEETRYFEGEHDLRIQKSGKHAKVWLKKGKALGETQEEVEVRVEPERFGELEKLFDALEYRTAIVWKKHRLSYEWDGVSVSLDFIKGYGHVAEFWLTSTSEKRLETLDIIRAKMAMLGLRPTPKPVLHERFSYYRDHWEKLITEEMKMPV